MSGSPTATFFGEIALLTTGIHQATVRTVDETQLLVLPSHDLERLMDRVPEIGRRIREIAHERAPDRMAGEKPARDGREPRPGGSAPET